MRETLLLTRGISELSQIFRLSSLRHSGRSFQPSQLMTPITVKLTPQEIKLLAALASDQLFRKEFIDPKMPGHVCNTAEVQMGKALVAKLRSILDPPSAKRAPSARSVNAVL